MHNVNNFARSGNTAFGLLPPPPPSPPTPVRGHRHHRRGRCLKGKERERSTCGGGRRRRRRRRKLDWEMPLEEDEEGFGHQGRPKGGRKKSSFFFFRKEKKNFLDAIFVLFFFLPVSFHFICSRHMGHFFFEDVGLFPPPLTLHSSKLLFLCQKK